MQEPFTPQFFRRLQQLKIRTRRAFLGSRQGSHLSTRRGHGLEFSDYRAYAPGDDFRYIDWGAYGRTDRLYVRRFQEEQDLNVMVMLDTSASMAYPEGENKYETARGLALALGYIALSDGDKVVFSLLGQKNTPRYSGAKAISRATTELMSVQPTGTFDFLKEVRAAIARQKIPGKCFIVSDFLFEFQIQSDMLDFVRGKNFDISCIQVLAPSELRLTLDETDYVVDAETGDEIEISVDDSSAHQYALELASHVEALEKYCAKAGIAHLLISSAESVQDVVLTRLTEVGVLK